MDIVHWTSCLNSFSKSYITFSFKFKPNQLNCFYIFLQLCLIAIAMAANHWISLTIIIKILLIYRLLEFQYIRLLKDFLCGKVILALTCSNSLMENYYFTNKKNLKNFCNDKTSKINLSKSTLDFLVLKF